MRDQYERKMCEEHEERKRGRVRKMASFRQFTIEQSNVMCRGSSVKTGPGPSGESRRRRSRCMLPQPDSSDESTESADGSLTGQLISANLTRQLIQLDGAAQTPPPKYVNK